MLNMKHENQWGLDFCKDLSYLRELTKYEYTYEFFYTYGMAYVI